MKFAAIVAFLGLVASAVTALDIPSEHHPRFLQEIASLETELTQWKESAAGQVAKKNGFYSDYSTECDDTLVQQDQLKRLFLTKLSIEEVAKTNPDASVGWPRPWTGPLPVVWPASRTRATAAHAGPSRPSVRSRAPTASRTVHYSSSLASRSPAATPSRRRLARLGPRLRQEGCLHLYAVVISVRFGILGNHGHL